MLREGRNLVGRLLGRAADVVASEEKLGCEVNREVPPVHQRDPDGALHARVQVADARDPRHEEIGELTASLERMLMSEQYDEAHQHLKQRASMIGASATANLRRRFNEETLASRSLYWSNHGIRRSFNFWSSEEKLDLVTFCLRLQETLAKLTPDVCFGYGTALGLVRGGDLIAHDDDADLLVLLQHPEGVDLRAGARRVAKHLRAAGYSVKPARSHVYVMRAGRHEVDVFVGFRNGDFVNWRPGSRDTIRFEQVFPPAMVDYAGLACPVPARAEEYLALVYGQDWRTPREHFRHKWNTFGDVIGPKK